MGAQSISNHSESSSMQKSAPCRLPWPCAASDSASTTPLHPDWVKWTSWAAPPGLNTLGMSRRLSSRCTRTRCSLWTHTICTREFGCELQPAWANGAWLFVRISKNMFDAASRFSKHVFCDSCTRTAFLVEHPDGMLCDKCQKLCGHAHFPRKAVTGESVEGRTGEIIRWHQSDKLSKKVAASTVCFTFATSWSRSVSEPIGFALLHCDESLLLQLTLAAPGMQQTSNINL